MQATHGKEVLEQMAELGTINVATAVRVIATICLVVVHAHRARKAQSEKSKRTS